MNEGLIPARYAKALYLVGVDKHVDQKLYDTMKSLVGNMASEPSLQEALSNPFISDADKCSLLSTAAGKPDGDAVFSDFLKLLCRNRRLDLARDIAYAYIDLYRRKNKIFDVSIVSAAPLSTEEKNRLLDLVGRHLDGGTVECTTKVDPSLIGGFIVSVGNERIDASISNELKQLRLNLIRK